MWTFTMYFSVYKWFAALRMVHVLHLETNSRILLNMLIHQAVWCSCFTWRKGRHAEGPRWLWVVSSFEPPEEQGQAQGSAPGPGQSSVSIKAGRGTHLEPCEEGLGRGGWQNSHEPAMCIQSPESKLCPNTSKGVWPAGRWLFISTLLWWHPTWSAVSSLDAWRGPWRSSQRLPEGWDTSPMKKTWESWGCSA